MPIYLQAAIVKHVINFYQPTSFALDKGGVGFGLFQILQAESAELASVIKGYNFGEKVIVDIDDTIKLTDKEDPLTDAAIKQTVVERATDVLREWVDDCRLQLPWDSEAIDQFGAQTFSFVKTGLDQYGRRRRVFSKGEVHFLDSCKMLAMCQSQAEIENYIEERKEETAPPVLDFFM